MRTSVLPDPAGGAAAQRLAAGSGTSALFELGLVTRPELPLRVAPVPGVDDAAPTTRRCSRCSTAVPHQPRRVALVLAGDADRAGWWGPGRPADWSDAVDGARAPSRAALAVELTVSAGRARTVAPRPLRPAHARRTGRSSATPASCTPRRSPRLGSAGADLRRRARPRRAQRAPATRSSRARRLSTYPVAHSDVALVVDGGRPGRRGRGGPARGRRRAAGVPAALRRLHRRPGRRRAQVPGLPRCGSARRTAR